jgi:hypothetical protein
VMPQVGMVQNIYSSIYYPITDRFNNVFECNGMMLAVLPNSFRRMTAVSNVLNVLIYTKVC